MGDGRVRILDFPKRKTSEEYIKRVIDRAAQQNLTEVVIIGIMDDGELYMGSTIEDEYALVGLVEKYKHEVLAGGFGPDLEKQND